jgi:hypothetical protein
MSKEELLKNPLVKEIANEFAQEVINRGYLIKNGAFCYEDFVKSKTKKDWTILSFTPQGNSGLIYKLDTQLKDKYCINNGKSPFHNIETFMNPTILSVRRESDGEVFTFGDKISCQQYPKEVREITDFSLNNNEIEVNDGIDEYTFKLSEIFKAKQKLFTTEDGVDIYEGDNVYYTNRECNHNSYVLIAKWNDQCKNHLSNIHFSTKEKAEEYIIMNKPCLSINDFIMSNEVSYPSNETLCGITFKKLKEIVKNKLKQ